MAVTGSLRRMRRWWWSGRHGWWSTCLVLGGLIAARPASAAASPPTADGSTQAWTVGEGIDAAPARPRPLLTRPDLLYGLASGAATVATVFNDRWLTEESTESQSRGEHRLALLVQPLGNLVLAGPALALVYGAGRLSGHPHLSQAAVRIGLCVAAAGTCTSALKQCFGRARPEQSPDEAWNLRPFSGHESFPSGHAALAFATASAITVEASAKWVPWVAFPLAALVGWSRVHDDEHWTSDVVAGAALGAWTARKTEMVLRDRETHRSRVSVFVCPSDRETLAGIHAGW